jgi:hypothetical protein
MRFVLVHVPALSRFTISHHLSSTACVSYIICDSKCFTSQTSGIAPQPTSLKSGMYIIYIYIYMCVCVCVCVAHIYTNTYIYAYTHMCNICIYTRINNYIWGTAVAQWLRYCATNHKVAGSIPDGFMQFFIDINPSHRTVSLESIQPLTEMSGMSIS